MSKGFQAKHIPDYMILRIIVDQKIPPDEALAEYFPAKVVLTKMEKMVERGLLDYGVSLRTAWLTEEGKALLLFLEDHFEVLG